MTIVALVDDLMDRSRLSGLGDVSFARDAGGTEGADVVVIDLARHADAVAAVRAASPTARIVAFGPHVDEADLDAARRDGADVVLARSRFFRDPAAALALDVSD
jgi:DNA-binding NarL/FixJ family response regulator